MAMPSAAVLGIGHTRGSSNTGRPQLSGRWRLPPRRCSAGFTGCGPVCCLAGPGLMPESADIYLSAVRADRKQWRGASSVWLPIT